jgi:aspartyl-tRNA(Asn)/glutamyl-tRNA(Gln) amidotransferase subunit B
MFCGTSAEYFGSEPNAHTCPVCLGLPGALPVINEAAINAAIKFALGLHCEISKQSKFDRKNYFYPDLTKGYQISQYDLPIGRRGWVEAGGRKIRINRVHQEEDTGKLIHAKVGERKVSLVDFNRSGVPLMEVVSEPDIDSPELAKEYAKAVHQTARYLEVSEVDMEKAGMRFDANVSIKKKGSKLLGEKVEIKNINSFRFLERALGYEIERQIKVVDSGGRVVQETRGWIESKGVTVSQRAKETSPDYRYFPEPDLPELVFEKKRIEKLRSGLPELPSQKLTRFVEKYELDKKYARILTSSKYLAQWFEDALILYTKDDKSTKDKARKLANWVAVELFRIMKDKSLEIREAPIEPAGLVELLEILDKGEVNNVTAKQILSRMFDTGKMAAKIIEEEGLLQVSQKKDLEKFASEVINENKDAVEDFKKGKEAALGFLIGQVMRKTKGRANPTVVSSILKGALESGSRN